MIPGFISVYKDNNQYIHLFFYPGLLDDYTSEYKSLDLSKCPFDFEINRNLVDNTIDYKFTDKSIKKIYCKLVSVKHPMDIKYINIKIK